VFGASMKGGVRIQVCSTNVITKQSGSSGYENTKFFK